MPDFDIPLLASAYENGQLIGRAFRWVVLLAIGASLVRRLTSGSFGPGLRRSFPVTVLGLVLVVAGLIGSVRYDFAGDNARGAAPAEASMSTARANIVGGCVKGGRSASLCGCYADRILAGTGHDMARFAALERDMLRRHEAGQEMPQLVLDAAALCEAQERPA